MNEQTPLSPLQEILYKLWVERTGIRDADHPASKYDYRGYWKDLAMKGQSATSQMADGLHFTDRYKQHGHPTFSIESQYSAGPWDGGRWRGEAFIPPGADFLTHSQQPPRQDPVAMIGRALQAALRPRNAQE